MKVRFLADADLNQIIVTGVLRREPAVDFKSARAAGLRGLKDAEVLARAHADQRVLVSHDVNTMPACFHARREAGASTSGLFLVSQKLDVGSVIEELLLIWSVSEAEEWENQIV